MPEVQPTPDVPTGPNPSSPGGGTSGEKPSTSSGSEDVPGGHNQPEVRAEELSSPAPEINLNVNLGSTEAKPSRETMLTSSDWEALTELIEAKKELQVAKRPFFDRVVMTGLIPFALIIAGPFATYYFANRAEEGIGEVKKGNEENAKLGQLVADLEATLKGAEVKIGEMDRARAEELIKMEKMVRALDDTMKNALIQMTVARIMAERDRRFTRTETGSTPMMGPVTGDQPPSLPLDPPVDPTIDQGDDDELPPEDVREAAMEQLQVPGLDGGDLGKRVANAYKRIKSARQ